MIVAPKPGVTFFKLAEITAEVIHDDFFAFRYQLYQLNMSMRILFVSSKHINKIII